MKVVNKCAHTELEISRNGMYAKCIKCGQLLSKHKGEIKFKELQYALPEEGMPQPENNIENSAFVQSIEHYGKVVRENNDFIEGAKFCAQWQHSQSDLVSKEKVIEVLKWACGYYDFPEKQPGQGNYYWRTHLRAKMKEIGIEIPQPPQI